MVNNMGLRLYSEESEVDKLRGRQVRVFAYNRSNVCTKGMLLSRDKTLLSHVSVPAAGLKTYAMFYTGWLPGVKSGPTKRSFNRVAMFFKYPIFTEFPAGG